LNGARRIHLSRAELIASYTILPPL
jgi:hypothetical protein